MQQTAHNELEQEVGKIAGTHGMVVQPERHRAGVPVDDHVHKGKKGYAAQLRPTELGQCAAILRGEIGQVVGELVEPVHARRCGRQCLCENGDAHIGLR